MKKLFIKITTLIVAIAMLSAVLAGCNKNTIANSEAQSYVSLKINPEVEFTVDGDGNVSSVNALNYDAEVLLSDMDLTGIPVEEAAQQVVEAATEAGYLDVDGSETENEVEVTVIDEDGENEQKIRTMLAEKVRKYFNNNGINGKVSEATLDMYAEQAGQLGISVGKMKMVLRAIDLNPEMTLSELAEMPVKDLVKLIKVKHNENIGYTLREEFKAARNQLRTEYAAMFTLGEELETLNGQLTNFTGTEEEKAQLEATIAQKQAEYDTLHNQYKEELKTLIDNTKAKIGEIKAERKVKKDQRKAAFKEKFDNHMQKKRG